MRMELINVIIHNINFHSAYMRRTKGNKMTER